MKTTKRTWFTLTMLALVLCGCVDDYSNNSVILPVPSDGKIDANAVPVEVRERFSNYINLYEGTTPPNIEGYYLITPLTVVYCSDGQWSKGKIISDKSLYFGEQTSRGTISEEREEQNTSLGIAKNVKITGHDNFFTAYFINETEDKTNGTSSKRSMVYSGEVTKDGLKNLQYGFIMLSKVDPNNYLMEVNEFRVFKDGDGMAYRSSSFAPARKGAKLQEMNECYFSIHP